MATLIANVLSRTSQFPSSSASSASSANKHITDAPPAERIEIGPATLHLKDELIGMYWQGVARELPYILLTLKRWQSRDETSSPLSEEQDAHVHGYDTFLDQVSHTSRQFAGRHAASELRAQKDPDAPPTYDEALEDRGWDIYANMRSEEIKQNIRATLNSNPSLDTVKRRAKMLLQSAEFLDIDKMIEYREPESSLSIWKRPASPQMVVSSYNVNDEPIFLPQRCLECKSIIRGCMFQNIQSEGLIICESCYRASHYGQTTFSKHYKRCCLQTAITPAVSRKLCPCSSVSRRDTDGRLRSLWPVQPKSGLGKHIKGGHGRVKCGLYGVTDIFAEAKYDATRLKIDEYESLQKAKRRDLADAQAAAFVPSRRARPAKLKFLDRPIVPEFGSSFGLTTDGPEDVPLYLRSIIEKYPYGNVHMALRIGPIVIENGVEK